MLGMIPEVEQSAELVFREMLAHIRILLKFMQEIRAFEPDLHGVALHGRHRRVRPRGDKPVRAQQLFMEVARKRAGASKRKKDKRKKRR